jgi:hypothetical protein
MFALGYFEKYLPSRGLCVRNIIGSMKENSHPVMLHTFSKNTQFSHIDPQKVHKIHQRIRVTHISQNEMDVVTICLADLSISRKYRFVAVVFGCTNFIFILEEQLPK